MNPTPLLLYGLATWRMSSLLVRERGPWDLFVRVRALAGISHTEEGKPFEIPDNVLAGILSCTWCCSVWVAIPWAIAYPGTWIEKIAAVFAISAVAIIVDRCVGN